jgi:hypothetical protein
MLAPKTKFDDFVTWQKIHQFMLQSIFKAIVAADCWILSA